MVLLVLAAAAHTARPGDFRFRRVVVELRVVGPALAHLEVADELLVLGGVLERVAALSELLRRRFYPTLRVGDGARVLTRGLAGGAPFGLALLRPLTITGHRGLAGLAMRRVTAAPLAVLAQLDAIRRVPLGLVRLVVAPLAVLACKRDRDSDISACHGRSESSAAPRERFAAPGAASPLVSVLSSGNDLVQGRAHRTPLRAPARAVHS